MQSLRTPFLVFSFILFLVETSAATELREPAGVLTLEDALAVVLLRNPELEEFSWQVRAAEARVLQAGLRPNPDASVRVEDVLGTGGFRGGRQAQVTLELGQLVELGGKRSARIGAADRARDLASREYEVKRVEVLAEVTRRFIELLARQDGLSLARANLDLGEATLRDVRRRVGAGADSPLQEKKATTALARARIVAEHAEHQMRVARRELAAMWGSAAAEFERAEGDLFARRTVPPYEDLDVRLDTSPSIVRGLSERELRAAEIRLAETKKVPNITLGGGVRRLEGPGDQALVFGLSMPLPVSDRNQGGIEEARALLGKAEGAARAAEVRLRSLLFGLHQELLHAATALDSQEREILPGAEESLELSRKGFAEGRFSYLELADAARTFGEVKQERIETAAEYHRFVLEIERLLGGPIEAEPPLGKVGAGEEKVP